MKNDEIILEGEQESSSSEEEQTTPEGSEAGKTPEVKDTIPYPRFKEVIEEKNSLKTDIEILRREIADLKQQQPLEEEEPLDWKEAEQRTISKVLTEIERKNQERAEEDYRQEQEIENSFEQLKSIGQEITPTIKRAVLTEMIKTGDDDVFGTYLKIKEKLIKTEKTEQQKKEGFIPSSEKGATAGKPGLSYKELKSKSLDEIIEQASKAKK